MRYPKNFPEEWRWPIALEHPLLFVVFFYLLFWIVFGMEPEEMTAIIEVPSSDLISLEDWRRTHEQ